MSFDEYYEELIRKFQKLNLLDIIKPSECNIHWPDKSGVYAIWDVSKIKPSIIYVGLTGKYIRSKVDDMILFKPGSFRKRAQRWTPYRFCESKKDNVYKYQFRYGPKHSNGTTQGKHKYDLDAYKVSLHYKFIEIHCFEVNERNLEYTPVLLESEILSKYLIDNSNLPPANNAL